MGLAEPPEVGTEEATEDEDMRAEPNYTFAKGYGRFGIGYTRLATALGNFEQGSIDAGSAVVAQWLTSGLRVAMARTGWHLLSPRLMLTKVPGSVLSDYYHKGYPLTPKMADRPYNQYGTQFYTKERWDQLCVWLTGNPTFRLQLVAWQACQQLQIVKLPPSVISLAEGAFLGCYVLREVVSPGCIRYGPRVFAECCSLSRVGASHGTEDNSVLAPGAQLGKYAFESCLTLTTITFDMDHTSQPRGLPEGAFCGACIEQLCLPSDFHNIGPRACENCKSLVEVNLMDTEITALPSSTFAHCVALNSIWLPPRLTLIGKEAFLNCVALQEVVIPTELRDIGNRAFCGCEQLQRFTPLDWGDIEQWIQAEHNAFFICDKFEKPQWVELLPAEGPDSDAFDEELNHEYCQYHASPW